MTVQASRTLKLLVLILLIGSLLVTLVASYRTDVGRRILQDPHAVRQDVQQCVADYPVGARAVFLGVYLVVALLGLPLWWLWMIAGFGFGLSGGVIWSQIGSTIAAPMILALSRWLAADWFHRKVEARRQRLAALVDKLGHNGFLVVMAIRLMHVLPFGLSYYALGLFRISLIDAAVGTLLGGIPSVAFYVLLGNNPHLLENWRYVVGLAALNVVLMIPVALRYLKPEWFKRIGVE